MALAQIASASTHIALTRALVIGCVTMAEADHNATPLRKLDVLPADENTLSFAVGQVAMPDNWLEWVSEGSCGEGDEGNDFELHDA